MPWMGSAATSSAVTSYAKGLQWLAHTLRVPCRPSGSRRVTSACESDRRTTGPRQGVAMAASCCMTMAACSRLRALKASVAPALEAGAKSASGLSSACRGKPMRARLSTISLCVRSTRWPSGVEMALSKAAECSPRPASTPTPTTLKRVRLSGWSGVSTRVDMWLRGLTPMSLTACTAKRYLTPGKRPVTCTGSEGGAMWMSPQSPLLLTSRTTA
mmetsp:Transcript_86784/g.241527  ORF Transcript_86784/g.241527 Transcript_86784/m.241527 type:complete len:215 (+) Transcript_86784:450-1094(+)